MRSSTDETIDSDNEAPRCGCPSIPWPLHISREIIWEPYGVALVALCFRCGATWEWGEICATEAQS